MSGRAGAFLRADISDSGITKRFSRFVVSLAVFVALTVVASVVPASAEAPGSDKAGWLEATFDEQYTVINLSWTGPTSGKPVAGYNIHRDKSYFSTVRGTTDFVDVEVNAGSTYKYQVTPIWAGEDNRD